MTTTRQQKREPKLPCDLVPVLRLPFVDYQTLRSTLPANAPAGGWYIAPLRFRVLAVAPPLPVSRLSLWRHLLTYRLGDLRQNLGVCDMGNEAGVFSVEVGIYGLNNLLFAGVGQFNQGVNCLLDHFRLPFLLFPYLCGVIPVELGRAFVGDDSGIFYLHNRFDFAVYRLYRVAFLECHRLVSFACYSLNYSIQYQNVKEFLRAIFAVALQRYQDAFGITPELIS